MTTIRTPDQRLRVFVSSTLQELAPERAAARRAIETMHLSPILFELGARPHPPQDLYRAYLNQSQIFVGIYWQSYGWIGPGMAISGLEDEFELAADIPKLIYVKKSAERQDGLERMLERIRNDERSSYKEFEDPAELQALIENDLAIMLTERFENVVQPVIEVDAGRRISNLPAAIDSFVGREAELDEIVGLITADDHRFVTLTGPGGIGKTRLAVEAARRAASNFDDGICFVPLASVTQPDVVATTIVQALDFQQAGVDPILALIGYLKDKNMLLVLDNFEQIVDAAPDIARVTEGCPRLTVLVTSRSLLNLRAEHEYQVAPLRTPQEEATLDATVDIDSVQLFVERARQVDPDFALDDTNARVIAEICRRLDGLPLAVELAAARTRLLRPEAILSRIDTSLQLLTGGSRDVPARHQTLRAAIDWSYGLLTEPEKRTFRRLSAFQGGCTLEAAETICNSPDLIELMTSLLEKSLIKHDDRGGEPRFSMLRVVWEFAREELLKSEDAATALEAHGAFYLELIEAAYEGLRCSGQLAWLDRIERDHDNFRSAMKWSLDQGDVESVAEAGWTLWVFWWLNTHLAEGAQIMQEALDRGLAHFSQVGLAKALSVRACMAFWLGDYALAVPMMKSALRIFQEEGVMTGVAMCQLPLGFVEGVTGSPQETRARLESSVEHFKKANDEWGTALALNALGWTDNALNLGVGEEVFTEAVERAEKLGTQLDVGMALRNLGAHRGDQGRTQEAKELFAKALRTLWRGYVQGGGSSYTVEGLAEIAGREGSPVLAVRLFGASRTVRTTMKSPVVPMFAARYERVLGELRAELGDDAYEREWSLGAAMDFAAAVELAQAWAEGKLDDKTLAANLTG